MGTHGRSGVSHLLLGSIAERVVRRAPCPVLTVRRPEHGFVETEALVAATQQALGGRQAPPLTDSQETRRSGDQELRRKPDN